MNRHCFTRFYQESARSVRVQGQRGLSSGAVDSASIIVSVRVAIVRLWYCRERFYQREPGRPRRLEYLRPSLTRNPANFCARFWKTGRRYEMKEATPADTAVWHESFLRQLMSRRVGHRVR
jgi:hypothetical protein